MERFPRIFVEAALWQHHKLVRFGELLGRNPTEAGGYLVRLWSWCGEYRPSGSLDGLTDREVSSAGGWLGKPAKFVDALRSAGLVDGTQVHDWQDNQGKYIERMLKERARKRRGRGADVPRVDPSEGSGSGSGASAGEGAGSTPAARPPTPREMGDNPKDMTYHRMMQLADVAKCPSQPATIRKHVEGLVERTDVGAQKLEAYLMSPDARGKTVNDWQEHFKSPPKPKTFGPKPQPETFKKLYRDTP